MSNALTINKVDDEFVIRFSVNNDKLDLRKIFNFTILDIVYAVNKDALLDDYECVVASCGEKAALRLVFKHLFKDIGMPPFHLNMNMSLVSSSNPDKHVHLGVRVPTVDQSIQSKNKTRDAPTRNAPTRNAPTHNTPTRNAPTRNAPTRDAPITRLEMQCLFPSPGHATCEIRISLDEDQQLLLPYEDIFIGIFKKMFKKVKGFIETLV
jgi:hypothetical protein